MILAIDPGTQLGFCTEKSSGSVSFARKYSNDRIRAFRDWLSDIVLKEKIKMVVYERPTQGMFMATRIHSHFEAIILLMCSYYGLGYMEVSAAEVKKWATGKGNAKKPQMIEACKERFGITPKDDNECDAMWIYDYATKSGKIEIK